MRTFGVKIKKHRMEKECGFTWPDWWGEIYQEVDVVAYEDHPDELGERTEGCVCVCEDAVWALIEAKNDPAITALDEDGANGRGRLWRPQVTRITDEPAVLLAVAKAVRGESLTAHEKKALDPDDSTPGVGKSKLFDVRKICEGKGGALIEAGV